MRERGAHRGGVDTPEPHLRAIDLDHGQEIGESGADVLWRTVFAWRIDIDLTPRLARRVTHVTHHCARVVTQVATRPDIENYARIHTDTLGQRHMNS